MMFEKGIRGGITHISKRYAEANNQYMKNIIQISQPVIFNILMLIISMGGQCHKNVQLMDLNGLII